MIGRRRSKAAALGLVFALALACEGEPEAVATPPFQWPAAAGALVVLEVEGMGEIEIALYPDLAPLTVANFQRLVEQGFYDGLSFHRVIDGFVVQTGDPRTRKSGSVGQDPDTVPDEFSDAPHRRGVVSMANRSIRGTASSQFFVVQADHPELDGRFTAFGRVVAGMEVVDAISQVETDRYGRWGPENRPIEDVTIRRAHLRNPADSQQAERAPTTATPLAHLDPGAPRG